MKTLTIFITMILAGVFLNKGTNAQQFGDLRFDHDKNRIEIYLVDEGFKYDMQKDTSYYYKKWGWYSLDDELSQRWGYDYINILLIG